MTADVTNHPGARASRRSGSVNAAGGPSQHRREVPQTTYVAARKSSAKATEAVRRARRQHPSSRCAVARTHPIEIPPGGVGGVRQGLVHMQARSRMSSLLYRSAARLVQTGRDARSPAGRHRAVNGGAGVSRVGGRD